MIRPTYVTSMSVLHAWCVLLLVYCCGGIVVVADDSDDDYHRSTNIRRAYGMLAN